MFDWNVPADNTSSRRSTEAREYTARARETIREYTVSGKQRIVFLCGHTSGFLSSRKVNPALANLRIVTVLQNLQIAQQSAHF